MIIKKEIKKPYQSVGFTVWLFNYYYLPHAAIEALFIRT